MITPVSSGPLSAAPAGSRSRPEPASCRDSSRHGGVCGRSAPNRVSWNRGCHSARARRQRSLPSTWRTAAMRGILSSSMRRRPLSQWPTVSGSTRNSAAISACRSRNAVRRWRRNSAKDTLRLLVSFIGLVLGEMPATFPAIGIGGFSAGGFQGRLASHRKSGEPRR